MAKEFNITGTCFPAMHYMADISGKLAHIMELIEKGRYFTINRPRQYGKTTMLRSIAEELKRSDEYLVFNVSFEGLGIEDFISAKDFCKAFLKLLELQTAQDKLPEIATFLQEESQKADKISALSRAITQLAHLAGKKMVLLIDEVDKSSNNQLFLDFLGMLRHKFLNRFQETERTFHSVILAGVHDVRTLKLKLRPDEEAKYNSPWNIASDFNVQMSLQPHEIKPMLEDYARERGVQLDEKTLAERLFYYTSGHPFLVSALCKITDEEILPERGDNIWIEQDVETAANRLINSTRSNTNFDSLVKNLENNENLYQMVFDVLMLDRTFTFNIHNPTINLGVVYGVFANGQGLRIQNRIYEQVIFNYLISKTESAISPASQGFRSGLVKEGNSLDMEKALLNFQAFMKTHYSDKDSDFLERNGRLVFLAFLRPIINGAGHDFIEPQISEEKRLDVAVTFYQHKYIVELKVWRGEAAHRQGLSQLAGYLDRQNIKEGYLVIFDPRLKEKSWSQEWIEAEGKRIFAVWV